MRDYETVRWTPDKLDAFSERTLRTMRRLPPAQRDVVLTLIFEDDARLGHVSD